MPDRIGKWTISNGAATYAAETSAAFEAILDSVHEQAQHRPLIATILSPHGWRILIGLGGPESVLQFDYQDSSPCVVTLGDPGRDGVESFDFEGQETEVPRWNLIPAEGARHAALEFFETGVRPDTVAWEQLY